MDFIVEYSMPIMLALLLSFFFLSLPELRSCVPTPEPEQRYKLKRADVLIMALISLAYACVGFYKLGDMEAPETFRYMEGETEQLMPAIEEGQVTHLMIYGGAGVGSYEITYTPDEGRSWYDLATVEQGHADVLKWREIALDYYITGGTIYISGSGNVWLGEVVALDENNNIISSTGTARELCDEQQLCPDRQTYMNSTYFDEIYHARTAWEHLNGVYPYEITHPPLGKVIMSIGIALFGMTPFGWRFSGTFIGVLMLPVIYIFAKKLFGGKAIPAACTLLMASDFMHFAQTRIATIDSYGVFFILLMYLFMYMFVSTGRWRDLALAGVFFGMGAASKWTCLYAGAGLAIIWVAWVIWQAKNGDMRLKGFLKLVGFCLIFFVLIPCIIYYLAYIPYGKAQGYSVFSADYMRMVLDNQSYMFDYHSGVNAEHPYSSRWYQWVLNIRPILYYLEYLPEGMRSSFGAFLNPALCWGGLMSLFVLLFMAVYHREKRAMFLLLSYLAQLVPWMFITRTTYEYHYFPCAAFLVLTMGYVFDIMRRGLKHWKPYVYGFTVLSVALFAMFYPVLSGSIIRETDLLGWLPTWPF